MTAQHTAIAERLVTKAAPAPSASPVTVLTDVVDTIMGKVRELEQHVKALDAQRDVDARLLKIETALRVMRLHAETHDEAVQ